MIWHQRLSLHMGPRTPRTRVLPVSDHPTAASERSMAPLEKPRACVPYGLHSSPFAQYRQRHTMPKGGGRRKAGGAGASQQPPAGELVARRKRWDYGSGCDVMMMMMMGCRSMALAASQACVPPHSIHTQSALPWAPSLAGEFGRYSVAHAHTHAHAIRSSHLTHPIPSS